jgi:small subunit ribosomal protein S17
MSEETTTSKAGPKLRTGTVLKAKMQKTVVVEVRSASKHPKYPKFVAHRERYAVHDEKGAKPGDTVLIEETRPLSKTKRWMVKEILERATAE